MKVPGDLYQAGSHYLSSVSILIFHLRTGRRSEPIGELIRWVQKQRSEIEKIRPRLIINEDPELEFAMRRVDELVGIVSKPRFFNTLADGLEWFNQNRLVPEIIAHLKDLGNTYNFHPHVASAN